MERQRKGAGRIDKPIGPRLERLSCWRIGVNRLLETVGGFFMRDAHAAFIISIRHAELVYSHGSCVRKLGSASV
jgi:hypothetical protein